MDHATGAIGSIISKLAELLSEEYRLQTGLKEQVESLVKELKSAQAFLQDIDKVPPDQLHEQVKIYASEVREASYDMEDVLDTFLVRVKGPDPIKKKHKKKLVKRLQEKMGSFFGKTVARHRIATAIDDIKKRLQEVTERRGRYTLDSTVTRPSPSSVVDPRLAAMYKQVTRLIAIDKPREEVGSLLSLSSEGNGIPDKNLKIVSIVGVGGLGKTTLAKAVYENHKARFSCCAFVPVGRNPDPKKVFRDILIELDKDKYTDPRFAALDERQLVNEVRGFLEMKGYFIVIDDVWDTKSWEIINWSLVENHIGSRIIITTRNSEVAIGEKYKLQPLSDDNSQKLLYARIFGGEDKCHDNQQQKVSEVADKILKKCGGVPLAIITMASYMVGKSMEEWLEVCNSIDFCGKDKDQASDTMWILSLSYYDLPSRLKTCLLYLSVFPEDYLIRKDDLIWMWIAEGFVISEKPGAGLFEIGEGYFNELINRSLIQPVEEEESMTVKGCRVHDMILDLTRSLSREANFATVLGNGEEIPVGSDARRLALQNRVVEDTPRDNCMDTKRARSLIAFRCRFVPRVHTRSFKLLRVLYLVGCHLEQLDEHVGDLHHLRCLGICERYVFLEIPEEIGTLKFLRVLDLSDVAGILPSSVGMLTQLVCLRAPLMRLPGGTLKGLTSLQELRIGYPGENDKSMGQFVKDLRNLSELRVLVVGIIAEMGERMQSDLLTSAGNLQKLQHLGLEGDSPTGLPSYILRGNEGPPSCIHISHLRNLSHLSLSLGSMCDQDLEILGALPELYYLRLNTIRRATLSAGTTPRGYFQKLRSCLLPRSTAHFVVNEEDSSVSFTMWHGRYSDDAPAFGPKRKQDSSYRRVAAARAVMPNLEALLFSVNVSELTACKNGSCDNLGLEHLASLQKVMVIFDRRRMHGDLVEKEEAALRHAIQAHPNRPTLQIKYLRSHGNFRQTESG